MADGATETSFAGEWARILVRAWCDRRLGASGPGWDLRSLRDIWRREVGTKPLAWYAEEKLRSGAYSAFLGLQVEAGGSWSALAVGDTCVAQVRSGVLQASFPIQGSKDFSNSPRLLASVSRGVDVESSESILKLTGEWQEGDTFYLMTDAMACWFLARVEEGGTPWEDLDFIAARHRRGFELWVGAQRQSGAMRNDDVTLLRLNVH